MLRWLTLFALGALSLCCGCIVQSIHPLFDDSDTFFDAGLVGHWSTKSNEDRWDFDSVDGQGYSLAYTDENGHKAELLARLVELDGAVFLDMFPGEPSQDENVLAALSMAPVHTLWKFRREADRLWLDPADMSWMHDYLQAHPGDLAHEYAAEPQQSDWPVITAGTPELRTWLRQHMNDDGLFKGSGNDDALHRVPEAAPAPQP
jgi:hypothetical protein